MSRLPQEHLRNSKESMNTNKSDNEIWSELIINDDEDDFN